MAYITKEQVQAKQEQLKALNRQYGVIARFSGSNSSSLVLTVTKANMDFISDYVNSCKFPKNTAAYVEYLQKSKHIQVNHYYLSEQFSGDFLEYLEKAYGIMRDGHFDDSDVMTDYFHCAWYNNINIGKYNKPFELVVK